MCYRHINWRAYKNDNTIHPIRLRRCNIISYLPDGKIVDINIDDPKLDKPLLLWVNIVVIGHSDIPIDVGLSSTHYVFGWSGERLSSLPEHEYYWKDDIWLTIGDRDNLFDKFMNHSIKYII